MRNLVLAGLFLAGLPLAVPAAAEPFGLFDHHSDVGSVTPAGSASFDAVSGRYTLSAAGANLVVDPAGIGAHDLRECLLIQIAAQQHEFAQVYGRQPVPGEDPHRSFRAEAEAQLEERRRAMEVSVLIVESHLPLLQKRDVKDLARIRSGEKSIILKSDANIMRE